MLNKEEHKNKGRDSVRGKIFRGILPVSISSLLLLGGLSLLIIYENPEARSAVFIPILSQVLIITFLTIFLVIISCWLVAERIIRPIKQVREAAILMGQGEVKTRINIRTNDEIDDLIEAFNSMGMELERLIAEIVLKQKTISQQKDDFVFIAAHELRAPVTTIRWILDDVINNPTRRNQKETVAFLKNAFEANERLVQLIQDLLEVARSEAGKLKIIIQPVNIEKVIDQVVKETSPLAKEKNHLVYYEKNYHGEVMADQSKLAEVVSNLLTNAIKYMKPGGRVDIWHEVGDKQVITHVKDNGIGMTEEEKKNVFNKFFRAENEDTREIQGTGLGLFITKEMVEKMGGRIWFESTRDLGSIFSFSLNQAKS